MWYRQPPDIDRPTIALLTTTTLKTALFRPRFSCRRRESSIHTTQTARKPLIAGFALLVYTASIWGLNVTVYSDRLVAANCGVVFAGLAMLSVLCIGTAYFNICSTANRLL